MSKRKLEETKTPEICERNVALRIAIKSSPASSWRELDNVGAALLGSESSKISTEEALRIANVWRLRQVELPHAIESTINIAEILYKEPNFTEQELRLLLAAVITRSVNGTADSLQQNRAVAASVAGLCSRIGIPTWIVQLRHNATHQQLPPLATLRMGATAMLTFFDSTFWTPIRQKHQEMYDTILGKLERLESEVQKKRELKGERAEQMAKETKEKKEAESSEDEEDLNDPFDLKHSRLGSTRNQFALLQSVKRKKKTEKQKTEEKSRTKRKREKMTQQKLLIAMASGIARDQSCSPDILFDVLLDFLVKGDCRMAASPDDYQSLLHAMGCEWPGFLPRLLVQCFKVPDETKSVSMVRYLCSKSFVQLFDSDSESFRSNDLAPANVLLSKLQYPLNMLCDQAKPDTTMHDLLVEILGADHIPLHGLQQPVGEVPNAAADRNSVWQKCTYWEPRALGSLPTD